MVRVLLQIKASIGPNGSESGDLIKIKEMPDRLNSYVASAYTVEDFRYQRFSRNSYKLGIEREGEIQK